MLLCRVTPDSGPAEEAPNPTKAWRALLERHGLAKKAAGLSGLRMFGLDTPTVAKLIQSLPNAARCAGFEAWARERPEPVLLVRSLEWQAASVSSSTIFLMAPGSDLSASGRGVRAKSA